MNWKKLAVNSAITAFAFSSALSGGVMLSDLGGKRLDNETFITAQKHSDIAFGLSLTATGMALFTYSRIKAAEFREK
ncbi:hypothetical protein [aff. Roholtiella sp. LEGE 12411]|uniref:hypothetical protein n=1 Tax=aff. Roholtiella sp. LEGE 12411 TaxID=1828822 RepID=UPI0018812852|nr:hypothetical protein [aff. Roholtiella sp. LEGE 12411]MBE9037609.1 hypothetical protein [aff. Roholtiella sp. LEGE 12411]